MQDELIIKAAALARSNPAGYRDFLFALHEEAQAQMAKAVSAAPDQIIKMCGAAQAYTVILDAFTDAIKSADQIMVRREAAEARKQRK